jgi:hypothetical protein
MVPRTLIALALVVAAGPVAAAPTDVAFETIRLRNVLACDLAPLLGSQFRYADELAKWPAGSDPPAATDFPGISILTAAHPTARAILAAGTARAVGELRAYVQTLDVAQPLVRITAEVYPAPPTDTQRWTQLAPNVGGVSVSARAVGQQERLSFQALPAGFKPTQIIVTTVKRRPEFIPLPHYSGFPQVLLAVAVDRGGRGQISVGCGVLGTGGKPLDTVKVATGLRRTVRLSPGERLALRFEQGQAAVTVILTVDTGVSQR